MRHPNLHAARRIVSFGKEVKGRRGVCHRLEGPTCPDRKMHASLLPFTLGDRSAHSRPGGKDRVLLFECWPTSSGRYPTAGRAAATTRRQACETQPIGG